MAGFHNVPPFGPSKSHLAGEGGGLLSLKMSTDLLGALAVTNLHSYKGGKKGRGEGVVHS